jgi:hypothetical protein
MAETEFLAFYALSLLAANLNASYSIPMMIMIDQCFRCKTNFGGKFKSELQ